MEGFIIQLGPRFEKPGARGLSPETTALITQILDWRKLKREPAQAANVLMRHYISNNGFYDVWTLWNEQTRPVSTDIVFEKGLHPTAAVEVTTGQPVSIATDTNGDRIAGLSFHPFET